MVNNSEMIPFLSDAYFCFLQMEISQKVENEVESIIAAMGVLDVPGRVRRQTQLEIICLHVLQHVKPQARPAVSLIDHDSEPGSSG